MDSLEQSRVFLDCFKANVNPTDPLPVRVPIYNLKSDEIKPAIVDWTRTYLDQFGCPQCILTPIVRKVLEAVLSHCKEKPESCGYTDRDYKTLQLNHEVIARVNKICTELLDNEKLNNLLPQLLEKRTEDQPDSVVAMRGKYHFARGLKHRRRTMEDRHVCLPDFNILFDTNDTEPTAFYGVYDGHGGQDAASFAASHLHYYIAQSVHYPHDMKKAFREGFLKTDSLFLEKCKDHHICNGTTAVACVHHLASKQVDIAWVGDSQAILIKRTPGEHVYERLVYPTHVASDPNERERIRYQGGRVIPWEGLYRVNGQLAISRAIGNPHHKPFVSAEPGISLHTCTEDDLILVMASDGLWEGCDEYVVSMFVLYAIRMFPDQPQKITDYLIAYAKQRTRDNITIIIVFLKDPPTIIKETPFIEVLETKAKKKIDRKMDSNGAANNGFLAENSSIPLEDHKAFGDIQNFMEECALMKPKSASPLCVGPVDDMGFLSDGGLGPETDVDGLHDSKQQSPSPLLEEGINHDFVSSLEQNTDNYNPFGLSSDVIMESPNNAPQDSEIEEEASSVSAEPVDLSEEHPTPESPYINGKHQYEETTEAGGLIGVAEEEENAVSVMKAELNDSELPPLKSLDEPIVNDLLGGDSMVDNKLIDQLDSFGISEAIRRQLIEQQVSGAAMNPEQEEDDDDGQLMDVKQSEVDDGDDGAEKEDLYHEKAFDNDNINDHHSADVKPDDDAGCCEDSEEDEWDYVKVNQQQAQQQQLEQHQTQEKPQESTLSEKIVEFANRNSFSAEELDEKQREEQEHEVEQLREQEIENEKEQQQQQEEKVEDGEHLDETAEPNTSEPPVDILGDNREFTVSESTKEVDDVIIAEAKEVVNLLNDFKEDDPLLITTERLCDTKNVKEENCGAELLVPSDSTNMEASMYGGSIAEQSLSPDSPISPVETFQEQQQQQEKFSHEKDLFSSGLEDTISPAGAEEPNEKHLYEAEEKTMLQGAGVGDLGWQLNPEAKEFVPVATPTDEPTNVFAPSRMMEHESFKLRDDAIVAQSPRKASAPSMEDLDLPAERDFQMEMDKRPHELEAALAASGEQQSPLSPNPFDLPNNGSVEQCIIPATNVGLSNGVFLQRDEADLVQFGSTEIAPAEEFELLNKVQQLPGCEDEEQHEPLILSRHSEPVQQLVQHKQEELESGAMETETNSAKEELYVEQKETVDEPVMDASSVSAIAGLDFNQLSLNNYTNQDALNPFTQSNTPADTKVSAVMQQDMSDVFGINYSADGSFQAIAGTEARLETEESKPFYQEPSTEASVYNLPTSEPLLLGAEESYAPVEPSPIQGASEMFSEALKEPLMVEEDKPVGEPSKENNLAEANKAAVVSAATGVAAATAVVVAAAAAASAGATSKTGKPKAPAAATAKKTGPASTGTKSSFAVPKDGAPKSAAAAPRVGSTTAATAASRKTPITAVKKAPITTSKPAAVASTNGMKEPRPASVTATKPTLTVKKPATDAVKTATTKTTVASSVTAARTKAVTAPTSTTKTVSASSTTRTAAPKPAATGTTSAVKSSSRLSTTGTTSRTVTSRPSSAVSTTSVPSKPPSATTTSTVKRTVAAKTTNGTTTTDGLTKTTRTSSSTTSSSVASRAGLTKSTGSGSAATKANSTLAAKKSLDAKPIATKTSATAGGSKPAGAARTSLAPKTSATSPTVRKVQHQNGVAKKSTAASLTPATGMKKVAVPTAASKKLAEQHADPTSTSTTTMTTTNVETNGSANESEMVMTPTTQSVDQLLVPVPQAM